MAVGLKTMGDRLVTVDPVWERIFAARDWGRYPNEELVRFVSRTFRDVPDRGAIRILEVGCASANNVWFMAREGFQTFGMDGSATAIDRGRARLKAEGVRAELKVGDALCLNEMYPASWFDAAVDVGCLQCNLLGEARDIVQQMAWLTRPGGRVFSLVAADDAVGNGRGDFVEPGSFRNITIGPLAGTGLNHFYTLDEVRDVFSPFAPLQIEYVVRTYAERELRYKTWVVSGMKAA